MISSEPSLPSTPLVFVATCYPSLPLTMSLSKDVPSSFLIAPDLLHDPRANYLPWKSALFKIAASQLPTVFVSGCLFLVQTQQGYDAFPLHIVSGNVIAPPTLAPPPVPVTGDTTLQREAFARDY